MSVTRAWPAHAQEASGARLLLGCGALQAHEEAVRRGRQLREDARVLHPHALLRLRRDQRQGGQHVPAQQGAPSLPGLYGLRTSLPLAAISEDGYAVQVSLHN